MRLKWIIITTALLLLGVVVAGYVALKSYDPNTLKPAITEAVKNATGRSLTLGHIRLKIGLIPVLMIEDVRLQNPDWASRPDLFRIRRLKLELALLPLFRRNIDIKRLVLVEPDIQIESDHSGVSNLHFGLPNRWRNPKVPLWEASHLSSISFGKVLLERARLSFKDAGSSAPFLVRLHSLEAVAKSFESPMIMRFRGRCKGKSFAVQAVTGSLQELIRQERPWTVKATMQALGSQLWVKGSIKDVSQGRGFTLSFKGEGKSTREMAKLMHLSKLPELGPFKVSGNVSDGPAKTYKLSDLRMQGKAGDVSGSLKISVAAKRRNLWGVFSSKRLDLMPLLTARGISSAKKKREKIFSQKPFKLDFPKGINGDLKIRAKQVVSPYGSMRNVQVDASLREGRLSLKTVKAAIGGGLLESHATCRREGKDLIIAGALKVQNLELKSFLKDLGAGEDAEGSLDAEIEFSTSGTSVAAMMARLNGKSVVTMGSGRIKSHYLRLLGSDVGLPVAALLGSSESKEDFMNIRCAVSGLQIRNGFALVTALVVNTPGTTVSGTGDVDLRTETLNLYLEPLPNKGVAGLALSFNELAKPLMLRGTLADPFVSLDPGKTALIVGKAIGGFVLFGPFGLVGVFAGKTSGPNACAAALRAAKKGVKASDIRKRKKTREKERADKGLKRDVYSGP
jgi:uncharacterized protein involved in outer membrane biogenesis